ncbi:hypothetical protein HMF8227_01770 [Saliniradius amylolyticus]|uniref:DUF3828 domain-containing protein n=1 Tax=Saliniradius amylolyticus TaxID=2183582 RepID=A0A2S2E3N5_9ALTE|nr:hypothetical protein [Saliniradius amylolyticus]AWL12243.1 hypothetical protein HMF8227_01770 [Saliniradius amylolyticus]
MRNLALVASIIVTIFITGCLDNGQPERKYPGVTEGSPEYTALEFFNYLYNSDSLDPVLALSTPKMKTLLRSYHTNRNAQRHVVNLVFSDVEMRVDAGNRRVRSEYSKESTVTIFFVGNSHGKKIQDLRTVDLIREGGQWLVKDVYSESYGGR